MYLEATNKSDYYIKYGYLLSTNNKDSFMESNYDVEDQLLVLYPSTKNLEVNDSVYNDHLINSTNSYQNDLMSITHHNQEVEEEESDEDPDDMIWFTSEEEVIGALSKASENISNCDSLRRCCKVLLRLLSLPFAKTLLWPVSEEFYPDYNLVIKKPICLSGVALKLVMRKYGNKDVVCGIPSPAATTSSKKIDLLDLTTITLQFYRDVRQVCVSCITYNTEATILVMHAQKILQALYRHTVCWVLSQSRPSEISLCDDSHCLLTHSSIPSGTTGASIKCSRCLGVYASYSLGSVDVQSDPGCYGPPSDHSSQSHDEWICLLCLREHSGKQNWKSENIYYNNEWGSSAGVPWLFNEKHSSRLSTAFRDSPHLQHYLEALQILANSRCSFIDNSCHKGSDLRPLTLKERITVLHALCELLKTSSKSQEYLQNQYQECVRLLSSSAMDSFREADFVDRVRSIAGDEGVSVCRSLLDGVSAAEQEGDMINRVIEGRCTVCKSSTFEEPTDGPSVMGQVVLCDGCNAEAHLKCLNMTKVEPAINTYYFH